MSCYPFFCNSENRNVGQVNRRTPVCKELFQTVTEMCALNRIEIFAVHVWVLGQNIAVPGVPLWQLQLLPTAQRHLSYPSWQSELLQLTSQTPAAWLAVGVFVIQRETDLRREPNIAQKQVN